MAKRKTTRRTSRKETAAQKAARYKRALATGKQSNGKKKLTPTQKSYNQGSVDMYNLMNRNRNHRS